MTIERSEAEAIAREIIEEVLTPDNLRHLRDERQRIVLGWVEATFGAGPAHDLHERAARIVEEAAELAQCEGVPADLLHEIVDHVYRKPVGKPWQESAAPSKPRAAPSLVLRRIASAAGGVGVTLLAYCEARAVSAEQCEREEFARAVAAPRARLREKQDIKAVAGIARYSE